MSQKFMVRLVTSVVLAGVMLSPVVSTPVYAATKIVAKKKVVKRSVSSIKGKDEKNFVNPTTRCLTKEMKALNAKYLAQMNADIKKSNAGESQQAQTYKQKLTTVWSAMEEPYCGYGSKGVVAVKKSFLKSVERTRAEFLASVKKGLLPATASGLEVTQVSAETPAPSNIVDNPLHISF